MTIYLSNMLCREAEPYDEAHLTALVRGEMAALVEAAQGLPKEAEVLFVTNEVGAGIVPENRLARLYRDLAGLANQQLAAAADAVYAVLCGIPLRIIDTAGIRASDDVVERIGVEKARSYVKEASLILALFDASRPLDSEDAEILKLVRGRDAILLLNKDDLAAVVTPAMLQERAGKDVTVITISTRTQDGLADLTNAITAKVYAGTQAGQEGTFVTDARQAEILRQADEHLEASIRTIEASMGLDFISIDLRSAWEKLGELTGETVGEDIINEIFSKFCIGK